ncbi:MAG: hypothetical protein U0354_06085 [Candidatus Sericytochromatia bacterium]
MKWYNRAKNKWYVNESSGSELIDSIRNLIDAIKDQKSNSNNSLYNNKKSINLGTLKNLFLPKRYQIKKVSKLP